MSTKISTRIRLALAVLCGHAVIDGVDVIDGEIHINRRKTDLGDVRLTGNHVWTDGPVRFTGPGEVHENYGTAITADSGQH